MNPCPKFGRSWQQSSQSHIYYHFRVGSNSCKDAEQQAGQRRPYLLKANQPLPSSGAGYGHHEASLPRGTGAVTVRDLILNFPKAHPTKSNFPKSAKFSLQASRAEFWAKNKALGRPMSPHLTIYKFQLTSMLSISHRLIRTESSLTKNASFSFSGYLA